MGLSAVGYGATFTVTTDADSGAGSLRAAMQSAAATSAADTINFNISPAGSYTINLLSPLPVQNFPVTINGTTQPGFDSSSALPVIDLQGSSINQASFVLIELNGGASSLLGLGVHGFFGNGGIGVWLGGGSGNSVRGCNIGVNNFNQITATGTGIVINQSANAVIGGTLASQRNALSGCLAGILARNATGCLIEGNSIGVARGGNFALPNTVGVFLTGTTTATTLRNNGISGNLNHGVLILGADNTTLVGNKIGISEDGAFAIGNGMQIGGAGVTVGTDTSVSPNNASLATLIGGTTAGAGNVISGNYRGIIVDGVGTVATIQGNKIGTNPSGDAAIGNLDGGIEISNGSTGTTIGGTGTAGNVISGNQVAGVAVTGTNSNNVRLEGNKIGTNAAGNAPLPNGTGCFLQGAHTGTRLVNNTISGNSLDGVRSDGADGVILEGNFIGTSSDGLSAVGNGKIGVWLSTDTQGNAASGCRIGGTTVATRNIISGNRFGVILDGSGVTGNLVTGNRIGTNATGLAAISNTELGIAVSFGASANTIGGTGTAGNLISGNGGMGVTIGGSGTVGNLVQGNIIGLDANLALPVFPPPSPDPIPGIYLGSGATDTVIGQTSAGAGAGNVIAGNFGDGILIEGSANTTILGNSIGSNAAGTLEIGNDGAGIFIDTDTVESSPTGIIGNGTAAGSNQIFYNLGSGVFVRNGTFSIRRNSTFRNSRLGINLFDPTESDLGVNANDPLDADSGPNTLLNAPVITGAVPVSTNTNVNGTIATTPNTSVVIDLYALSVSDDSGFGEGRLWQNTVTVTTNATGTANWTILSTGGRHYLYTATATVAGATSEFSANFDYSNGVVQFSALDVTVSEGVGNYTFTLNRTGVLTSAFSVTLVAIDLAAVSPADYSLTTTTVNFAANATSATGTVSIKQNNVIEGAVKDFLLRLVSSTNNTAIGSNYFQFISITDDDIIPSVSVAPETIVSEGNTGFTNVSVPLTLDRPYGQAITVRVRTDEYQASPGLDYTAVDTTVTFPSGTTTQSFNVPILGDLLHEQPEAIIVTIYESLVANIGFPGIITITDNDPVPTMTVQSASANESAGNLSVTVSLSAAAGLPFSAQCTAEVGTTPGSATLADFTPTNLLVNFPAGSTSQVFIVPITPDALDEANETLTLTANLLDLNGTQIQTSTATGTIIDDDSPPTLSATSALAIEPSTGSFPLNFMLHLNAASGQSISVTATATNGTAMAGTDFTATSSIITFAPGQTDQPFSVPVLADSQREPDEFFTLAFTTPVNVSLPNTNPTATIIPLHITNFSITNSTVLLNFRSGAPGQMIRIETSPDLQTWTPLSSQQGTGNGALEQATFLRSPSSLKQYYRLRL